MMDSRSNGLLRAAGWEFLTFYIDRVEAMEFPFSRLLLCSRVDFMGIIRGKGTWARQTNSLDCGFVLVERSRYIHTSKVIHTTSIGCIVFFQCGRVHGLSAIFFLFSSFIYFRLLFDILASVKGICCVFVSLSRLYSDICDF